MADFDCSYEYYGLMCFPFVAPVMLDDKTKQSIVFMRAVLTGKTFSDVGYDHALTGNAVSQRIKRLALRLCTSGFLMDIKPEALNFVNKLREYREQIEAALYRIESGDLLFQKPQTKATLSLSEIAGVLHRASLRSIAPLRDVALVHIALMTGAKPVEVARMRISDYLNRDGSVRNVSVMRANIAYNQRERPLLFQNANSVSAIDAYLAQRRESQETARTTYCGFRADEFLFLNDVNCPFNIVCIRGVESRKYTSPELVDTYTRILARSGLHMRLQIFRRTLARRMLVRGASEGQIGAILGIADGKNIRKLLPPPPSLEDVMKDIFPLDTNNPATPPRLISPPSRESFSGSDE
jgi:integrase